MQRTRRGFILPLAIIGMAGILILMISLLSLSTLERKTARAYSNGTRAEFAMVAGEEYVIGQIMDFLSRPEVGGAAFSTWAYHPGEESEPGHLLALTSGRPEFDNGSTAGAPFLDAANTEWLGTIGGDPDALMDDFQTEGENIFNFNADGALGQMLGACLARWQEIGTDARGRRMRFAVWVDDESSRLDVTRIAELEREDGNNTAEIPFFGQGKLASEDAAKRKFWLTGNTARVFLGDTKMPMELSEAVTSFNRGYDVLAFTPSFTETGASEENGFPLPLRGRAKRNVNWSGHVSAGDAEERVERLAEWMTHGAKGFFNKRNLGFWSGSGTQEPLYQTLPSANPFASDLRREQFRTISASLIDYLDPNNTPTQPASLASLDFGNPLPGAAPVLLMRDVPRPSFFGADRTVRINEVQIVWNSRGAQDGFNAKNDVTRTSLSGGRYRYEIPVTYRFELWNMDENPIPATSYEVRTTYIQQILGSTFGSLGAQPIPEETEVVFPLNSGNPIAFAPNEIKVFDITRTYVRESNLDRGTTWSKFKDGATGTGDDQPDGHQRQAHVLLDAATGEWLHASGYLQMSEAPTDGVVSAGLGNKGDSKGNRLNDPRMTALRMYYNGGLTALDADRDWSSNKPGKMGAVNNALNGFNYQDFTYWLDRPHLQSINTPLQGVTRVENRPMRTPGELGRIFDPSWTHPAGRGSANGPFNRGVLSPFRGGGTLAVGQASKATLSGTTEADHLDAKPWNIMDIFAVEGDGSGMTDEEFGALEWHGKINLNCRKTFVLSGDTMSNHELVMELPALRLGAAGRPEKFKFGAVADELKSRLTKGAKLPDGSTLETWKDAIPLYSPGQLGELESWGKVASFNPPESTANGTLALLNRSDPSREEAMMRTANLVTTRSHCYRLVAAGEVLSPNGEVLGRRIQEKVIFFNCTWDSDTGELLSVKPETLYARSL